MRSRVAESLRASILSCARCPLHTTRTQAVPFSAPTDRVHVALIGEAPGAREDESGAPFIGPAGQLLFEALESLGRSRDEFLVNNILSCRPPRNDFDYALKLGAVESCRSHFSRVLQFFSPTLLIAFGNNAYKSLCEVWEGTIGRVRGKPTLLSSGHILFATYHPAYILRTPSARPKFTADLASVLRQPPTCSSEHIASEFHTDPATQLQLWYEARDFESKWDPDAAVQGRLL